MSHPHAPTIAALRATFGVILPRLRRDLGTRGLGYGRPATAQAAGRTNEYVAQIAAELGEWPVRIAQWNADAAGPGATFRRIARHHRDEAAVELAEAVGGLLPPLRDVVARRAAGQGWRAIAQAMPDRPMFSIRDDWERALICLVNVRRHP